MIPRQTSSLFVRGEGGKIVVDFVDPDATEQAVAEQKLVPIPELEDSSDSSLPFARSLHRHARFRAYGRGRSTGRAGRQIGKPCRIRGVE